MNKTKKPRFFNKSRLFNWRRRRDSNPRTAFDRYTISNRARSTNYATSPRMLKFRSCSLVSLPIIIHEFGKVKEKICTRSLFCKFLLDIGRVMR